LSDPFPQEAVRVREGDGERTRRFDRLFDAYRADIVAYCSWRAASPGDAEDAVAEVFLAAWRRLEDVPEGAPARVWLYATARRVIANQRRSSRRREALEERLTAEVASGSQHQPEPDREDALVHEALACLGQRDREVLLLAEWEGLSADELASVLGCPAVTARGRLHRARRRFRAVFEDLRARDAGHPSGPMPRVHQGAS
jgi:RNA polymerase sigma factor (sigma-70 family)